MFAVTMTHYTKQTVWFLSRWRRHLTSLLTVFRGSVVRLVDGDAETLVASPAPDHVRARTVEGHLGLDVAVPGLRHRCLEALQGAGLPEAEGRTQRSTSRRL